MEHELTCRMIISLAEKMHFCLLACHIEIIFSEYIRFWWKLRNGNRLVPRIFLWFYICAAWLRIVSWVGGKNLAQSVIQRNGHQAKKKQHNCCTYSIYIFIILLSLLLSMFHHQGIVQRGKRRGSTTGIRAKIEIERDG